ncbi:TPA: hypothetical protein EYP37_08405 [Candidatus Poribacteria bacterium]|nr:hypothetical protein [Candidatus Poribacteria bacterium]
MRALLVISIFLIISPFAETAFEDIVLSPRALAMGETASSSADGLNFMWNPSLISRVKSMEAMFSYLALYPWVELNLYPGERERIGYHMILCSLPLGRGRGIGLGWLSFRSALYLENTLNLAYGERFIRILRLGCAVRFLNRSLRRNEYARLNPELIGTGFSKNALTFDVGLLMDLDSLKLGASITGLYPADIGFISGEILPSTIRIGIGRFTERYTLSGEIRVRNGKKGFGVGFERRFLHGDFALRIGLSDETVGLGWGYKLRLGGHVVGFDYAFIYPISRLKGTYGSHLFSLRLTDRP